MAGINWDAEMNRYYPDPQQEPSRLYCDCCEEIIYRNEEFVKIPGLGNYCMDCIDNWTTEAD